jgi:lauroyl/myristoyl acyltransferase
MLKTMSISKRQIDKRLTYDYAILEALYKSGKSVQAYGGHFMNWEYANFTLPVHQPYTFLGVYMPLANQVLKNYFLYAQPVWQQYVKSR